MICIICGQTIKGYGNNAQPLANGTCCDECNIKVVLKRIELFIGGKKK